MMECVQVHILRTDGYFIGQVRGIGCRNWRTITGKCRTGSSALAAAVIKMRASDKRARSIFVPTGDTGSYYGPSIDMEARRT